MDLRDGQNGGSRKGALLIALIIAVGGFLMYLSNTEENPITGVKQHVSITPEQEIRLGLQSAPQMAAQMGGEIPSSDPRAQEVQKIGQQIVSKSLAHKGPWQFRYHLLADPKTINAFALPGGQIFITLGLLNKLQNEGQLAGVLAHETGHVIQRHSAQQMAKGQLGQIFIMATGIGVSDPNNPNQGQAAAAVASIINQVTQLHYSRHDELEADEWGLKLMAEAGYNPKAMLEVMRILESAAPGEKQPEMLLTHPYPEHRIESINAYLKKYPASAQLSEGRDLKEIFSQSPSSSNALKERWNSRPRQQDGLENDTYF
jgi:predicted Zn-dependent protease